MSAPRVVWIGDAERAAIVREATDALGWPEPAVRPLAAGLPMNREGLIVIDASGDEARVAALIAETAQGWCGPVLAVGAATDRVLDAGTSAGCVVDIAPSARSVRAMLGAARVRSERDAAAHAALARESAERESIDGIVRREEEVLDRTIVEKRALVREVHHRVKNNLQIVSSLLSLQSSTVAEAAARAALDETRARIRVMALIHERLYQSDDFVSVLMNEYLVDVARHQLRVNADGRQMTLDASQMTGCRAPLKVAIPCGFIVNELVARAVHRRATQGGRGYVRVNVELRGDDIAFSVHDDADPVSPDTPELGDRLVDVLVAQVGGSADVTRAEGTRFEVLVPLHG